MSEILKDPMFFYAIAFVIFLALAYRYGYAKFLAWIDGKIAKIREQLGEAEKLRAEAEAALAEHKSKQAAAMSEADLLIRNAKEEVVRLKAEAETELKALLARHEQQALERIRMAEMAAMNDVRQRGIDLAMKVARQTLEAKLQGEAGAELIDQAIAGLPTASSKAKAA